MFLGRFSVKLAEPRAHTLSTRASELRHAAHRTLDQNSNSGSLQLYPPLHQKKIPYMRSTFPAATTPGASHAPCCHVEFAPPTFQSVSGRDARRRRIGPCARQTPAIRVRFLSHRPLAIPRNCKPSVPCRNAERRPTAAGEWQRAPVRGFARTTRRTGSQAGVWLLTASLHGSSCILCRQRVGQPFAKAVVDSHDTVVLAFRDGGRRHHRRVHSLWYEGPLLVLV